MKRILPVIALLFLSLSVFGQKVKLIESFQQDWSGGLAGYSGQNYTFIIEFSLCDTVPIPDTIWLGQEPVFLSITDSPRDYTHNVKRTIGKKSVRYTIMAGVSHIEAENLGPGTVKNKNVKHSPIQYSGPALVCYKYNGQRKYYVIDKILSRGEPINYP